MALYLIQISLCLVIFNLAYEAFFRRDTFFARNRIYLIGSLILTFILPLLPIPELFSWLRSGGTPTVEVGMPVPVTDLYDKMTGKMSDGALQGGFSLFRLFTIIYLFGVGLMLIQMISEFVKIRKMMNTSVSLMHGNIRIFVCEGLISHFSFFRNIFLNKTFIQGKDKEYEKVLTHEIAHVEQGHSFDLLLAEFVCIIQWFNPFAWFYRKSLQEVHEFLADNEVLQSGCRKAEYQAVLVNQALGIMVFSLSNNFNQIKLKKRIIMMSKMKSSNFVYWKTLIILPVIMLALSLSGSKAKTQVSSGKDVTYSGKVIDNKTGQTLSGAAVIVKGTTVGTLVDENGMFKINTSEGSTLIISYVGYETYSLVPEKAESVIKLVKKATRIDGATIIPGGKADVLNIPANLLVIIDGEEFQFSNRQIDPDQIESMNVLKDDAAIKSYGDKGKNGVIIITTKKADQTQTAPDTTKNKRPNSAGKNNKPYSTTKDNEPLYTVVEQFATFQDGDLNKFREYVLAHVKYPAEAVKNKIEGKVILQFVVNHLGDVSEVKIIRGVSPMLDMAASDAVKSSPRWKPGMQSGKAVAQIFIMPVNFVLNSDINKKQNKK